MDPHPTPFPGKNHPLKPNPNRKVAEHSKPTSREHVTYRQKRAFGTVRNANIPTRSVFEKPAVVKPSIAVSRKQHQSTRPARVPAVTDAAKKENSSENPKPKSNQKRVVIQEEVGAKTPLQKLQTPVTTVASASLSPRKITARVPVVTQAAKEENSPENPKPKSNQKRVVIQEEVEAKTPLQKLQTPVTTMASPSLSQRKITARVPVVTEAAKENSPENLKHKSSQKSVSLHEIGEKTPINKLRTPVITTASPSLNQRKITARAPVITEAAKKENPPENPKPKLNQKKVSLQEVGEKTPIEKLRTPVTKMASPSPSHRKMVAGSTYQSAKICSKCRFDKLETSTYWLAQIKLSESVGKHFVSAAFFRLAFESKAEPIRKLRLELKSYLVRNGQLAGQTEWKEVCVSYGVLKDEEETESSDSAIRKLDAPQIANVEHDQELSENLEHHHVFCETETD